MTIREKQEGIEFQGDVLIGDTLQSPRPVVWHLPDRPSPIADHPLFGQSISHRREVSGQNNLNLLGQSENDSTKREPKKETLNGKQDRKKT